MDRKDLIQRVMKVAEHYKNGDLYATGAMTDIGILVDEYTETVVKNCSIPVVVKSLPTDECVEQWWAEGQDQQKGFWQEAPYRTNGDVVEEIKTALKYFIETWQR